MTFANLNHVKTQLISLLYELSCNLDQNIQTDLISLDFAKAFNTVPHRRLLYKLHWYRIQGDIYIHKWVTSFLVGRTQNVLVDNNSSSKGFCNFWCPSGLETLVQPPKLLGN